MRREKRSSNETVEIIDLHADPEKIPHMVDNVKLFPGFHMNKKHWLTLALDGSCSDETLQFVITFNS